MVNVQEPGANSAGVGGAVGARPAAMEALPELYAIFQGEVRGAAARGPDPGRRGGLRRASLPLYCV